MTVAEKYIKDFFNEKEIPYELFEIKHNNMMHFMDTENVIDLIRNAPPHEKREIQKILIRIDFRNGNVNDFLKHLATSYIQLNS
jgi:hypothetical protein